MADQATVIKEIQAKFTANITDYRAKMRQLADTVAGMTRNLEGVKRTAAAAMSSPSASTQKLGRELDATAQKLQAQKDRFDSLSRSGERTARQMEQLQGKLTGMSNAYRAIQAASSTIDLSTPIQKQADAAKAAVGQIDVQMESLSASLKNAGNAKFVSLDSGELVTIDQARAKLAELSQAGVEAAARFDRLQEAIRSIGTENLGYANAKGLEQLKAKIDGTTERLNGLGDRLKDTSARAERLSDEMKRTGSTMEQQANSLSRASRMTDGLGNAFARVGTAARRGLSGIRERLSGISSSARQSASSVNGLGNTLRRLGAVVGAALSVGAITSFGKSCIELGSDLAEVQNVVEVTFSSMSSQVDQFAKNAAKQFGLSETMAKRYTGTFGAMSKTFGFSEQQAYSMSTALTGLAGDVASFYNITQDEAYTKLKSVFTGETESLKELGVVMTQTALDQFALSNGFGKTTKAMTEQEKVALRYAFVQKQLAAATGDFARTSDSWANQVRILRLQFESLKATLGQALINVLTPVLKMVNTLIGRLTVLADRFKAFTEMLTGKKASGTSGLGAAASTASDVLQNTDAAANASDALADSTEMAGEAAKKTAKEFRGLMGFDEINKLNEKDDASVSGSPDTASIAQGLEDGVSGAGDLASGLDHVAGKLDGIAGKLGNIWDVFQRAWASKGQAVMKAAKDALSALKTAAADVGKTVYDVFTDGTGQRWAESVLNLFRSQLGIVTEIAKAFDKAWKKGDNGKKLAKSLFDMFSDLNDLIASINDSFSRAFSSGVGVSIWEHILRIATNVNDTIGAIAKNFRKAWENNDNGVRIWKSILKAVDDVLAAIDRMSKATADWAKDLNFDPIVTAFADLGEAIEPLIDTIANGMADAYEDVLLPLGKWTIEKGAPKIVDILTNSIKTLTASLKLLGTIYEKLKKIGLDPKQLLDSKLERLSGVLENIAGAIGLVNDALSGMNDILNGKLPSFDDLFDWQSRFRKTFSNMAIDLNGMVNPGYAVGEWVGNGIGKKIKEVLPKSIDWLSVAESVLRLPNPGSTIGAWIGTGVGNKIREAIPGLVKAGKELLEGLKQGVMEKVNSIRTWLQTNVVDPVVKGVRDLFGIHSPSTVFAEIGADLIRGLVQGISDTWNTVTGLFSGKLESVRTTVSNAWNGIQTNTTTAWGDIRSSLSTAWTGIQTRAGTTWRNISSAISTRWTGIRNHTTGTWKGLSASLSGTWGKLTSGARTAWNRISSTVSTGWNGVRNNTSSTWNSVKGSLSDTWSKLKSSANTTWGNIKSSVSNSWNSVKNNTSSVWSAIRSSVSSVWSNMKSSASSIMGGIRQSIVNGWSGVTSGTSTALSTLTSTVSGKFGSLKSAVSTAMSGVKTVVRGAVDDLKGMFRFSWSLPQIRLPHFSWSWTDLGYVSIPNISVSWYAKGGILDGAQLFGAIGSTLLGGGEAGREAVLPLDRNNDWMDKIAERTVDRFQETQPALYRDSESESKDNSLMELLMLVRELRHDVAALRQEDSGGNSQPLVVQSVLDGKVIATSTVNIINQQARATGVNPLSAYI